MTGSVLAPLVPALAPPVRSDTAGSDRLHGGKPLPLARLVKARQRTTVYGLTTVDAWGRLADVRVMAALGWSPGLRLRAMVANGVVVLARDEGGRLVVNARGRVHLPAGLRRACAIDTGDRVLLAADADTASLAVYPLCVLDAMVDQVTGSARVGEVA